MGNFSAALSNRMSTAIKQFATKAAETCVSGAAATAAGANTQLLQGVKPVANVDQQQARVANAPSVAPMGQPAGANEKLSATAASPAPEAGQYKAYYTTFGTVYGQSA